MPNLTRASHELFKRTPDETFESLGELFGKCREDAERSTDRWRPPKGMEPLVYEGQLNLDLGDDNEPFALKDWAFTQLCGIAKVSKDTLNQLTAETAPRVFSETLPPGNKPAQLFTRDDLIRSIHGHSHTRLHDRDVVSMLMEFAVDFGPPQHGANGGTGLYRGEQDLFCFMVDPTGWVEIEGEAFAPGFFAWNSEVGRRSVGIQSFWFQAVCANHIVWDAIDVKEVVRTHTSRVGDALPEMRRVVEALVSRRDERRDGFASVVKKATGSTIGDDAEEAMKVLSRHGIGEMLASKALETAKARGRLTIFSVVDALTKIAHGHLAHDLLDQSPGERRRFNSNGSHVTGPHPRRVAQRSGEGRWSEKSGATHAPRP